jgi:hypothetical protein
MLQAYVMKWIVPEYTIPDELITAAHASVVSGFTYLIYLSVAIFIIILTVFLLNRRKV